MNLRKGLVVLPLAAILFSCGAKTLTYDDAVKFIKENYTATEEKAVKKATEEFIGHPENNDASKAAVRAAAADMGITLDDKFYGKKESAESGMTIYPMNEANFKEQVKPDTNVTLTLDGKRLTVAFPLQEIGPEFPGYKFGIETTCDDKGYPYIIKTKTSVDSNGLKYAFDAVTTATEY